MLPDPAHPVIAPRTKKSAKAATPVLKCHLPFVRSPNKLNRARPSKLVTQPQIGHWVRGPLPAPPFGRTRAAEEPPTVVIITVVVTVLELGVTGTGLNVQAASAGMFAQAKLTGAVKEPCGVIVSVTEADCPWGMLTLVGFAAIVKFAGFTVCVRTAEVLARLIVSPP